VRFFQQTKFAPDGLVILHGARHGVTVEDHGANRDGRQGGAGTET
jgi:hypothetical protein